MFSTRMGNSTRLGNYEGISHILVSVIKAG